MLHLPVSKYILLYNHYDNSEHSDLNGSVIYQVIGHAKCDSMCTCVSDKFMASSGSGARQARTQEKTIRSAVNPVSCDRGNVILDLILPLRRVQIDSCTDFPVLSAPLLFFRQI